MDTIGKVKQNIDIVEIVGSYVELKKAGRNYKGVCPFHSEKTPSFMVSPELQIYKCFGCNQAGDAFKFIQEIEGVDFNTALEQLAEKAGVKLEKRRIDPQSEKRKTIYKINDVATQIYHYLLLKHKVGKPAREYLKDRGLTPSTIKNFKLGYAPDSWSTVTDIFRGKNYNPQDLVDAGISFPKRSGQGYIDKFRGRILFPLTGIDGKIVGFTGRTITDDDPKYLNTNETLVFHKGFFIYGLDKAKVAIKQLGAVFVEGQMDVISAHQAGITNVIATSGTALVQAQLKLIKRYTSDLTFCFDTDTAGISAIYRAIELAEKEDLNVTVCLLPEKYQDLDEFVQNDTKKAQKFLSESKIPVYDFFLATTLKKYDKHGSIGKKKIMDELIPLFNKIKSPVTLDHYIKRISDELDLEEATVKSLISGTIANSDLPDTSIKTDKFMSVTLSKKSPQEYILALLLKADLDTTQTILYKLGQRDFTEPVLQEIFTSLKSYLIGRKKRFEVKYFINRFSGDIKTLVNEFYLWDLTDIMEDPNLLVKELDSVFTRIKKSTIKREMRDISARIKEAELAKDTKLLKEYTTKFKELSAKLI